MHRKTILKDTFDDIEYNIQCLLVINIYVNISYIQLTWILFAGCYNVKQLEMVTSVINNDEIKK